MISVERGIVVAGYTLPATEWCIRDAGAWWHPGSHGTRKRSTVVDMICGHWTAGEAGLASYDDDGPFVVRGMRSRMSGRTGKPLDVGIHFVIGACAETDDFARVWQTSDPGLSAVVHVGSRLVYPRSIGVEVVNVGRADGVVARRGRTVRTKRVLGGMRALADFRPGQYASWVRLCEALTAPVGPASGHLQVSGIQIPRCVPVTTAGTPLSEVRRMGKVEVKRYAGALEHVLVPGTTKTDAGGLLLEALTDAGWERRPLGV